MRGSLFNRDWLIGCAALVLVFQISIAIVLVSSQQSIATAGPPCAIRYMTLNPNSETPGPIVTPGMYSVWTGEGLSPWDYLAA